MKKNNILFMVMFISAQFIVSFSSEAVADTAIINDTILNEEKGFTLKDFLKSIKKSFLIGKEICKKKIYSCCVKLGKFLNTPSDLKQGDILIIILFFIPLFLYCNDLGKYCDALRFSNKRIIEENKSKEFSER